MLVTQSPGYQAWIALLGNFSVKIAGSGWPLSNKGSDWMAAPLQANAQLSYHADLGAKDQWPLLLTWFSFNPSIDE